MVHFQQHMTLLPHGLAAQCSQLPCYSGVTSINNAALSASMRAGQLNHDFAGLIFLSAMATSIADEGKEAGKSSGVILGTALLTTAVATVLVGICIILVGDTPLPDGPGGLMHDEHAVLGHLHLMWVSLTEELELLDA